MGGMLARLYLAENPNDNRVRKLVTMGTPHWGAGEMLKLAYSGFEGWGHYAVKGDVRPLLMSFPSIPELFPFYDSCCFIGDPKRKMDPLNARLWYGLKWFPADIRNPSSAAGKNFRKNLERARQVHGALRRQITGMESHILAASKFETVYGVTLKEDGSGYLRLDKTGGDDTVPYASASNSGFSPQGILEADARHERIFNGKVARQNLKFALIGSEDGPRTVKSEIDLARIRPGWKGKVRLNFFGVDVEPTSWISGQPASVQVSVDYSAELDDELKVDLVKAREFIGEYIFRLGLKGVCADDKGRKVCFEFSKFTTTQAGETSTTLTGAFLGKAPDEAGFYRLSVDQNLADLDLSTDVYVRANQ
jgi:hypothetical protein